ncbi:hypothetical protein D3C86_2011070 [compost metagenome]
MLLAWILHVSDQYPLTWLIHGVPANARNFLLAPCREQGKNRYPHHIDLLLATVTHFGKVGQQLVQFSQRWPARPFLAFAHGPHLA